MTALWQDVRYAVRMLAKSRFVSALVVLTLALAGVASGFLYEVSPMDPFTIICVSLLLVAVALLASYIPARRAARIDPMEALRYE